MRRLMIAALSALMLLCTPFSDPQGCGLHSIRWTPFMINLLIRAGAPAATNLRPVAPPAQAPASERGAAPSAQESVSLEPGKPVERELSGGQSHFYKITMTSGQYLRITVSQRGIDALVALFAPDGKKISEADMKGLSGEDQYSVATVPWTQFYSPERGLALHAAYWHDRFGVPRSHGCINLSPIDARWLYFWSEPVVPAGWTMTAGVMESPGSVVRVRSKDDPNPQWKGYAKKVVAEREAQASTR